MQKLRKRAYQNGIQNGAGVQQSSTFGTSRDPCDLEAPWPSRARLEDPCDPADLPRRRPFQGRRALGKGARDVRRALIMGHGS